jgi:hypothetical protein
MVYSEILTYIGYSIHIYLYQGLKGIRRLLISLLAYTMLMFMYSLALVEQQLKSVRPLNVTNFINIIPNWNFPSITAYPYRCDRWLIANVDHSHFYASL